MDMERNELTFRLNNKEINFDAYQSMKQPQEMNVVFVIYVVDEVDLVVLLKEKLTIETLSIGLMNFDRVEIEN